MKMTLRFLSLIVIAACCIMAVGCSEDDDPPAPINGPTNPGDDDNGGDDGGNDNGDPFTYDPESSLKSLASYPIGMIVSASKLSSSSDDDETFKEILLDDFNSITAENDMKMANMFSGPDSYDWSDGDAIVAYAKANGLRVHGHALLWHQSIPGWLNSFSGTDEEFETQIENYVKATVAHFAEEKMTVDGEEVSVVASWDVVNEAFEENGSIRSTLFSEKMGDDYVSKMFQWAREGDADVKLFYNDYNLSSSSSKMNAVVSMVDDFETNNIPIDGIGFQMHVNHDWPQQSTISQRVGEAVATGLLIHFSELDIKVNYNDDIAEFTEARAEEQEAKYKEIAEEYNKIPAAQRFGITIWGMRDQDSWIYDGGTDWPLLYDNDFNYKIAHRGFADGLE